MIVKTRIFTLCKMEYGNLSKLAQAMGISVSQIYRVQQGKRYINQKFIVGAIKAFPNHRLDDLFYLAPELPTVNNNHRHQYSAIHSTNEPAAKEKQIKKSAQQATGRFTIATEEYGRTSRAPLVPS